MIFAPTGLDAPTENFDPAELLIKEARQKARRRRLRFSFVLLVAVAVIVAVLIGVGRRSTEPTHTLGKGLGGGAFTNYPVNNVANLAGSNSFVVSGSHVWVAINRESPTSNFFAVTELNANDGSLVRITKNVPASVIEPGQTRKIGDLAEPGPMVVSGSHLWVANDLYWNVTELNAKNGALVRVINAKADSFAFPDAIAVGGGHVWVANGHVGANSVTELNATNGALVRVINAKADGFVSPSAIAVGGSHVFVLNAGADTVTELNAISGALIRIISAHAGCCVAQQGTFEWAGPTSLALSGTHLWITDQHNYANGGTAISSVVELNAGDGSLVRVIKAKADGLNISHSIAVSQGHVWVQNGNNTLTELNANDGSLIRIIDVKLDPQGLNSAAGLAISGPYVLVLNIYSGQRGSVTVLSAVTGGVIRVIQ